MATSPDASSTDAFAAGKRALLRHGVATLAYRAGKAVRSAPPELASFRAGDASRTALQLLTHMGDLLEWALSLAEGEQRWKATTPSTWDEDSARFFAALGRVDEYLGSDRPLGKSAERILQGPIADALTHVGQLMMLRRLADCPVRSENYAAADIVAGRVSVEQSAPKFEFD